jgi:diacylglycerol O-acyltransferase / wax synthase
MVPLPMGPVRRIKDAQQATVNDVLVAIMAGALRSWMFGHGDLPAEPLIAAIPVSVRSATPQGGFGNEVGVMTVELPTDEFDPLARLVRCRDGLRGAKERHQAVPASLLRDATDLIPPMLFGQATRTLARLAANPAMNPLANLVISNVPGPRKPLFCSGCQVQALFPVSTLGDSLGLNITIFSYLDQLNVGLLADPKLVPDLPALGQAIRDELDLLFQACLPAEKEE